MRPATCPMRLLTTLVQLGIGGRCAAQILQAHGPEEGVLRLCNATANITTDCVTPNHTLLTALVAFLSFVLFIMICSMTLPLSAQNRILRCLGSACGKKARHISYVDAGLYKTRNAVCRREVYVRHVWRNGRQLQPADASSAAAAAAAGAPQAPQLHPHSPMPPPAPPPPPQPPLTESQSTASQSQQQQQRRAQRQRPPRLSLTTDEGKEEVAESSGHRVSELVPIRIEPAPQEKAAPAAGAGTEATDATGTGDGEGSWTELQSQHPALVCDALFCYRSDPNIRQSSATSGRGGGGGGSWWPGTEETQRLLL